MSDLKACPFCGSYDHWISPTLVACDKCDAHGPTDAHATWNHRPEEDRLRSALQAAERERDEALGTVDRLTDALRNYACEYTWDSVSEWMRLGKWARDALEGVGTTRIDIVRKKLAAARAELARLREAIEFYADPATWYQLEDVRLSDGKLGDDLSHVRPGRETYLLPGKRAREALGK